MGLSNLVRASIFCALAIGLGYSLMLVPNIELITVIVFLCGLTLGPGWGILVGGTAMFIFSGLNPLGSGLSFPPLFLAQIISEMFIGATGGWLRPLFFSAEFNLARLGGLAFTGFMLTFIYDSLTIISWPLSLGLGFTGAAAALVKGIGFTLLHEISNSIIFLLAVPRIVKQLI